MLSTEWHPRWLDRAFFAFRRQSHLTRFSPPRLALLFWFLFATNAYGAEYYVPDEFPTIQEAVDFAADGDTVFVDPGIYRGRVRIGEKALSLIGTGKKPRDVVITESINWFDPTRGRFDSITLRAKGDINLYNLTIKNNFNELEARSQGLAKVHTVAARFDGRVFGESLVFYGTSDTLNITGNGFFKNVKVYGTNDFIYGKGSATFVDSVFISRGNGAVFAQGSAEIAGSFDVYRSKFIEQSGGEGNRWLARPWGDYSTVRIIDSYMNSETNTERYKTMGVNREPTLQFFECGNRGPDAATDTSVPWAEQCPW